ncbi:uncharacterized protein [Ptychodera flava]|uniref:uncharacterized protein n=1 Tax=Ptychodera flava TaxID=63121 RepID=UPI00396A3501
MQNERLKKEKLNLLYKLWILKDKSYQNKKRQESLNLKIAASEDKKDFPTIQSGTSKARVPKLPEFNDGKDDMDAYLVRFELFARSQEWEPCTWAVCLSALLTGKALSVYTCMPVDDAMVYEKVKAALLHRYDLNEEGFRRKFRIAKQQGNETATKICFCGMPVVEGIINDVKIKVLRDSGCSGVVVRSDLVKSTQLTGEVRTCVMIDGTCRRAPVARLNISTPYYQGEVDALCMQTPIYDLIIGNIDGAREPGNPNPSLCVNHESSDASVHETNDGIEVVQAVQTRAQVIAQGKPAHPMIVSECGKEIVTIEVLKEAQQTDPSLKQVRDLVKSGKGWYVATGEMPLLDTPFKRVAVDLIGPIDPVTDKGNRYILTVVDYATRYPEAVPLKRITTEVVAEALYVLDLRERLEETCKLARKELLKSQFRYKYHFDKKTKERHFKVGERVLLLLPTEHDKLKMQWQGPYVVKEKVGPMDYRLEIKNKLKLYQANLLKNAVRREVESMLEMGVIEPSDSPYASPIVLINKKHGTIRFCIVFRKLNKVTTFDAEPMPNSEELFTRLTGSSGLGAVVLQEHEGGKFPVVYASRKLLRWETAYSVIEKECLALVWGIRKFQQYLYGKEFLIETDHQPLIFLNRAKVSNGRLMRWALYLQSFRYRIVAIKGTDNVEADYLSRSTTKSDEVN